MKFNLAFQLILLAFHLLATGRPQLTSKKDVRLTIKHYPHRDYCEWEWKAIKVNFPHGLCYRLPRDYMNIKHVSKGCNATIYKDKFCTKGAKRIYKDDPYTTLCTDIREYDSINVICDE
ncbi:hypothetical protein FLONG3_3474 [Fusarium longipes]|uniref:Uncharacterized protein n=1 Tax=Fusarium longipes TaxID=694270 RepID=A0A395T0V4_9HYPO|nr:hypothetical protein FLONG3_3474 [Fusarium longipes]